MLDTSCDINSSTIYAVNIFCKRKSKFSKIIGIKYGKNINVNNLYFIYFPTYLYITFPGS